MPWQLPGAFLFIVFVESLSRKLHIGSANNAFGQAIFLLFVFLAGRQIWFSAGWIWRSRGRAALACLLLATGYILLGLPCLKNFDPPSQARLFSWMLIGGLVCATISFFLRKDVLRPGCSVRPHY